MVVCVYKAWCDYTSRCIDGVVASLFFQVLSYLFNGVAIDLDVRAKLVWFVIGSEKTKDIFDVNFTYVELSLVYFLVEVFKIFLF